MGSSDSETTPCTASASSSSKDRRKCQCNKCVRGEVFRSCRLAQRNATKALQGMLDYTRNCDKKKDKKKVKKNKKTKTGDSHDGIKVINEKKDDKGDGPDDDNKKGESEHVTGSRWLECK